MKILRPSLTFFLILLLPSFLLAYKGHPRHSYGYNYISLNFGSQLSQLGCAYNIELLLDKKLSSCLIQTNYWGIGLSASSNSVYREICFKGLINPLKQRFIITRSIVFDPFLFINWGINSNESSSHQFIKPGIGINGRYRILKNRQLRTSIYSGIHLPSYSGTNSYLTIEIKIGLALRYRWPKHKEKTDSQE
jgi:hypothetical protein